MVEEEDRVATTPLTRWMSAEGAVDAEKVGVVGTRNDGSSLAEVRGAVALDSNQEGGARAAFSSSNFLSNSKSRSSIHAH